MKKLLYFILSILITSCCLYGKIDLNDEILKNISFIDSENPIFFNLEVGTSTISDVTSIMNNSDYLDNNATQNPIIRERDNGTEYVYQIDQKYGDSFWFYFENDSLKKITLIFPYLKLGRLISQFGEPESLYTVKKETPREPDLYITFLFKNAGIVVLAGPTIHGEDLIIDDDARVASLILLETDHVQSWIEHDLASANFSITNFRDYLYVWKGYGKLSDLYPNVIQAQ
ncbi:MAG: hypothetical protein HPY85_06575 [Anaerolineae bacterium]|nr:hypothetical protein [Anaerolineae bacterium]